MRNLSAHSDPALFSFFFFSIVVVDVVFFFFCSFDGSHRVQVRAQPARFFLCCPRCHSWVLDVLHHHRSCLTIVPVVCAKKINGSVSRHHHGRRTHTNAAPLCRDGRVNEASRPSHHVLVSICKFNPVSNFGTPQHHVTHIKTHSLCVFFAFSSSSSQNGSVFYLLLLLRLI